METTYLIGRNMCGYMPDSEPYELESFEAAKKALIGDLLYWADDEALSDDIATDFTHAAEDVNLWSTPGTIIVNGWAFWIEVYHD